MGTRNKMADQGGPVVTFPDDYPNSVRHFLLIGFLSMFIGAGCFFYMGVNRKVNSIMHTVVFFICAVTACSYYANWSGLELSTRPRMRPPESSSGLVTSTGWSLAPSSFLLWHCSRSRTRPLSSRCQETLCFTKFARSSAP